MEKRNLKAQDSDSEMPEDLGIKVGSEDEAMWTQARDKLVTENKRAKMEIEINSHVIELCEKRIQEEQEKRLKVSSKV